MNFACWALSECERIFDIWRSQRHEEVDQVAVFSRGTKVRWGALSTFAREEAIEPTNDAAMRALDRTIL
jgi:hypothetical protein